MYRLQFGGNSCLPLPLTFIWFFLFGLLDFIYSSVILNITPYSELIILFLKNLLPASTSFLPIWLPEQVKSKTSPFWMFIPGNIKEQDTLELTTPTQLTSDPVPVALLSHQARKQPMSAAPRALEAESSRTSAAISGHRVGYIIYGAHCKMKRWGSFFENY